MTTTRNPNNVKVGDNVKIVFRFTDDIPKAHVLKLVGDRFARVEHTVNGKRVEQTLAMRIMEPLA